jgi:Rieske Fe-S protein
VVARWSGQVAEPDDGFAFIGRVPTRGHAGCYVITGDSGMGLTHATLGAMLVTDLAMGRENPWAKAYDPARGAWRAAGEFVKENVNAAAQLADYVKPGEVSSVEEIAPGCGAVMRDGASRLAVYRDEAGTVHSLSAVCPHLKCSVRWNGTEKSWDCPCHGSRFDAKGKLIMGPSIDDLAVKEPSQE